MRSLPLFPLQPRFWCYHLIKTEAILLQRCDINTAAGSRVSTARQLPLEKGTDFKAVNIQRCSLIEKTARHV